MAGGRKSWSRPAFLMAAAFAALAALMGVAVAVFLQQQRGSDAVRHTVAVEAQSWRILSLIQDAETGQRGYLLTGQDPYLDPYDDAAADLDAAVGRLAALTEDNAAQRERIGTLRGLVAAKLAELREAILLRRGGDADAAAAVVATGAGKAAMDDIRAVVAAMQAEEAGLLERRQRAVARVAWIVWGVFVAAGAMLLVLGVWAVGEAARRASLARFLPAELSQRLARSDSALRAGQRQRAAVAFADIRGSTAIAEGLDPADLSVLLTSFRRRVAATVARHGGVVDKFLGDGALVVFGIPEPAADDAARALGFATDLVAAMAAWNAERPSGEVPVAIGVGVHYGEVFCGIIGDETRLEFTVLGDTVNVASRLEGATKAHGVAVLVSEAAWRAAGAPAGWREASRAPLAGRREAMPYLTPG